MRKQDLIPGEWTYVNLGNKECYGKRYIVTKSGEIYSNMDNFDREREHLRPLFQSTDEKGYIKVKLYDIFRKPHTRRLHRIILESFSRKMTGRVFDDISFSGEFSVDHIDQDTSNNRLDNLRWLNFRENTARRKSSYHNWTNSFKDMICVYYFKEKYSINTISRILQRNNGVIRDFLHGLIWPDYVKTWCEKNGYEYILDSFSTNRMRKNKVPFSELNRNLVHKNPNVNHLSPETP